VFRRQQSETSDDKPTVSSSDDVDGEGASKPQGKGRPTPKRRDVEAARKGKVAAPKGRKEARARMREERLKERERVATALKTGDERHYPARDQGKARRIARNWIDGRRNVGEIFWPLVITALVLLVVPVPRLQQMSTVLLLGFYAFVVTDTAWSLFGLRRVLQEYVPDSGERRGALPYAFGRSLQSRKRRRPSPIVERGWTKQLRRGEVKADQTKAPQRD
jgi:hypothetical protein